MFSHRKMFSHRPAARRIAAISGLALATGVFAACRPPEASAPSGETASAETVTISGAGASFPAPLYQRWFSEYNRERPNVQISYQSIGSGAGVNQYLAKTVDFGATDAPLTQEEREKFRTTYNADPIQVPMTGGAVVFAYNLGGEVENLRLSREAYCGIVQGEITRWNDPTITTENPGVTLPDTPIRFVHRSDGSGTTFIFTNHVEEACPDWTAGAAKSVSWPIGTGAKGNEGITAQVQQTPGSIGYVEYAYARENGLNVAALENRSGEYIEPTPEAAALALEGQTIPADFALEVPDPSAAQAYPIVGLTWLLLYSNYDDPAKAEVLQSFVNWALSEGDQYATELGYIPLTSEVAQRVQSTVDQELASR